MGKAGRVLHLQPLDNISIRLERLTDNAYFELHRRSLAIHEDLGFYLFSPMWRSLERLSFGQVYVALKALTGASGKWYDDWKGSFSFPFKLDVTKGNCTFNYLLNIRNFRSHIEFSLRKVVDARDPRLKDHLLHQPFADEFSQDEINSFIAYFYSFLTGYLEVRLPVMKVDPFVQKAQSNHILFGYYDGQFFEQEIDSSEEFNAEFKYYRDRIEGVPDSQSHAVNHAEQT